MTAKHRQVGTKSGDFAKRISAPKKKRRHEWRRTGALTRDEAAQLAASPLNSLKLQDSRRGKGSVFSNRTVLQA